MADEKFDGWGAARGALIGLIVVPAVAVFIKIADLVIAAVMAFGEVAGTLIMLMLVCTALGAAIGGAYGKRTPEEDEAARRALPGMRDDPNF